MHWNQGHHEAGCRIPVMLRKGLALIMGLGVLAATGVASPTPCCTLQDLSRLAAAVVRDCCERPDCCRVEKRGTAQAALSIKAPEVGAAIEIPAIHPVWIGERSAFLPAARLSFLMADHPPPGDGRDTHLRISLLRI